VTNLPARLADAFSDAEGSETLAKRASASAAKRRDFHFRAFGTETFSISADWGLSAMSPMEPSELFLASAVTGAAVLIEVGAFIHLGII
jgi:hypothetical protein